MRVNELRRIKHDGETKLTSCFLSTLGAEEWKHTPNRNQLRHRRSVPEVPHRCVTSMKHTFTIKAFHTAAIQFGKFRLNVKRIIFSPAASFFRVWVFVDTH